MKITLKVRVFLLVSVLIVSAMVALTGFLLDDFGSRLQDGFAARGAIIVKYFAIDCVEGLSAGDTFGLHKTVARLFELDDVVYAGIYDRAGLRIAGAAVIPADEVVAGAVAERPAAVVSRRAAAGVNGSVPVLDFVAPTVDENGERVGWVQMGLSLERVDAQMRKAGRRVLLLLAAFVAVGSIASFLIASSITRPIRSLTRVFAAIAGGDLDHEIGARRRDEIGSLSANFAAMRDSIRHKLKLLETEALVRRRAEEELARHRDNLEELVKERTAELAGANLELKAEINERRQVQERLKTSLDELARHNQAMMGREKRIAELKAQVNGLLAELGRPPVYEESERTGADVPFGSSAGAERAAGLPASAADTLTGIKEWQTLLDSYCASVGIAAAIIDLEGRVLVGARWQQICTHFHRQHPETCRRCIESDTVIANQVRAGERASVYTCRNGLTDAAAPIIVNGQHVANFFVGQFLLDPPDEDFFRRQAATYGFPEEDYLAALADVPMVAREKLESILSFLSQFAVLLGSMEVSQSGLRQANAELRESQGALLSIMEDLIEARERAEEWAQQADGANQSKSEFLANMSHEIRTPMTAILGYADVLLESGDLEHAPPDRIAAVETIKRNGEYLMQIINDILDLSKIEAGKMTIERIRCAPCQIIAEVASLMRVRADAKGLALEIKYRGAIPETIATDPTRLRQVLINVIGNAIKFTEVGGVRLLVELTGDHEPPLLQFDVVDTGLGMSPAQVARLFQPFTQADTSTTRKFGGTGLGLAISKRLAQELGGDIALVETSQGGGTRFRVTVATGSLAGVAMVADPLMATTVSGGLSKSKARSLAHELAGETILLAEDGPDNQRLIAHILRKAGASVTVVDNGKLAVEAATRARDAGRPFDVILMDMQMPQMDGYEATRVLRAAGYAGTIIALTAHAMASDREKCRQAGCDDYAAKPIDRDKLIERIKAACQPAAAAPEGHG
jgi:signal transduction histidine kinase/ActR/RegA family two-component response regulator